MKKAIENIGEKVLEFIYDFENNCYEYDGGCYERENGVAEGPSVSVSGTVKYGGHYITVNASAGNSRYVEVLFEDDEYCNLEPAVQEYVEKKLDYREMLSLAIDDVRENSMDEYQRNGFRNEADFRAYVGFLRM